jgi:hypothetical protein
MMFAAEGHANASRTDNTLRNVPAQPPDTVFDWR